MNSLPENKITKKKKWVIPVIIASAVILFAAIASIIVIVTVVAFPKARIKKQLKLGDKYISELDYENAVLAYKEAIQIDPKNEEAYIALANAYLGYADFCLENGDEERAIKSLDKAIKELGATPDEINSPEIEDKIKEAEDKKTQIDSEDSDKADSDILEDKTEEDKDSELKAEEERKKQEEEKAEEIRQAYQAYLDFLNNNPGLRVKDIYSVSQIDSISVCDCYGDENPEMIYLSDYIINGTPGAYELKIVTFKDGNIIELISGIILEGFWAGIDHYRLFNCGEDKTIYALNEYGDDSWCCNLNILEPGSDGKLNMKSLYMDYAYPNDDHTMDIHEYSRGDQSISKSEFESETKPLIYDVRDIFHCELYTSQYYEGDSFGISDNITRQENIMTYDEAVSFLQEMASK